VVSHPGHDPVLYGIIVLHAYFFGSRARHARALHTLWNNSFLSLVSIQSKWRHGNFIFNHFYLRRSLFILLFIWCSNRPFLIMTFHVQPGEKILSKIRKHWFILFRDGIGIILGGLLLPIFLIWLSATGTFPATSIAPPAVWTFVGTMWFLIVWMVLATIWTNYYLDSWIVTDKRIIYIEQVSLFSRKITTLRMERVQDVTDEAHGVLETLLHFGTLRIQTAGASGDFTIIQGIPHPDKIRNIILDQVDIYTEKMNEMYESAQSRHDTHKE
jgi:membrane protein YdbS with pleckstrin-like domain